MIERKAGRLFLKCVGMDWFYLILDKVQYWDFVSRVMDHLFP
jgi:hypothetical protein